MLQEIIEKDIRFHPREHLTDKHISRSPDLSVVLLIGLPAPLGTVASSIFVSYYSCGAVADFHRASRTLIGNYLEAEYRM